MAAFRASGGEVEVGGRRLAIRNLDRVLYPQTGTTKGELLGYYVAVADVMLAHLRGRQLHMHRYPEGVGGPHFWQKGCPEHKPPWVPTAPVWSAEKNADIEYCVVDDLATLLWAVNIGSLELHTSLHRAEDLHRPTVLAFDLDPGEGTDILACCEVGLRLRELFGGLGLRSHAKTSGSKGLQVYVPLNTPTTYAETKPVARAVAELLEAERPDAVVSRMAKRLRAGRVLVDWSQNTEHKSMVCAYSVRAKARPTVSAPVTWAEVESAVDAGDPVRLVFEIGDVLERVEEHGDLFAGVLTDRQELRPAAATAEGPRPWRRPAGAPGGR
ncbi:MAG: bifunctional non-ous end joining protein LigD [Solirubrobacteraceae bacterium]|nr:bifunctional non-ous end joining protein LigD [Solirubrobacteraceae bacterium]MEA2323945.1 bifunctional non-ous end joining protein LigD [Solirubrobacteraceae bacterium]